ncbi:MAG: hypothetical protein H6555_09260 [Lewinellaceae bacterium]|nr:hypothetical protein [Lewinellaceae bacterium]
MKFTTEIYEISRPKISLNNKIVHLSWGIILVVLLGLDKELLPDNSFVKLLLYISIIIPGIVGFYAFFAREEMTKKIVGTLEVELDKITWNGRPIKWDEMETISMVYFDYSERPIYTGYGDFGNSNSNGLDNIINITLKDSTAFEGNFLMKSKQSIQDLREVLWGVITENNISLRNARNIINPENYKEHQEIKKYCSQ